MTPSLRTLLVLAGLAAAGCVGTETGNPPFEAEVTFAAYSSSPLTVALEPSTPGATVVEDVWVVLGPGELLPDGSCSSDSVSRSQIEGLGAANHAAGAPALQTVLIDEGSYCGLNISLDLVDEPPTGAPEALAGRSVLLRGRLPDNRPFEIGTRYEGVVRLRGSESFSMSRSSGAIFLGFDPATWLDGVDLAGLEAGPDGILRADGAPEVVDRFESNLHRGLRLLRHSAGMTGPTLAEGQ